MKRTWWKESVVYQIYPRSFRDSNGDGIGDLRGIIEKMDYLQALGITVVWLSPVYRSPNDDNGYDISDYQALQPEFGTLADWEELLAGLHQRGIKLVMDLVVNHTSDEHPWFVESRKSKDNPYRDYYFWRPGKDGHEPNNWSSFFGGSAWEYDAATDEYMLHLFSRKQPDLNWANPQLRRDIYQMMRWWLDKGVDGFRMDVINLISKTPGLPDAPVNGSAQYHFGGTYFANGPRLLDFLAEMKREVLGAYDILTVGEAPMTTTANAIALTDEDTGALSMVFHFEHMDVDIDHAQGIGKWGRRPWQLSNLKAIMTRWQGDLTDKGWNSIYLANHDQPRSVSRFGSDGPERVAAATLLATFVHLLHGTPYIYQGEEIGMTNVAFPTINDYRDIETLNMYHEFVANGLDPASALALIQPVSRDNARTPLQWDSSANAGFTTGTPWLAVNPNYTTINVAQALDDPASIFAYYQRLIVLRKANPVVVYGSYALLLPDHPEIFAWTRTLDTDRLLVILNFSSHTPRWENPSQLVFASATLLISNYTVDETTNVHSFALRPWEARVYRIGAG